MDGYFRVNDLAPEKNAISFYIKRVGEKKSDGFCLIDGGEIFVIDCGRGKDDALPAYLLSLRRAWLEAGGRQDLIHDPTARLELQLIVSHAHSDHMGSLPYLLSNPFFCVTRFLAPERALLAADRPDALEHLLIYEDRLSVMEDLLAPHGHVASKIERLPFGRRIPLPTKCPDTELFIFTAPYDWSETRESDKEGLALLKTYVSPTYENAPELAWTNGILNGNSLWVKVTKHGKSALITGDQRPSDEMLGAFLRFHGESSFACDILKLPHHGEKNYYPALFPITSAQIAIFTASNGFETPETVSYCKEHGIETYYACDGDLVLKWDENGITASGIRPR